MDESPLQALERQLRASKLDIGGELAIIRRRYALMAATAATPAGITTVDDRLGGVDVVRVRLGAPRRPQPLLFFHGGAYAIGSARGSVALAARLSAAASVEVISVDYRLAPEHPYPAALEDGLAAYTALLADGERSGERSAAPLIAGESAGAGLALAVMMRARADGLPLPPAAVLMSPWVDFELRGGSLASKAADDPLITPAALRVRTADYLAETAPADALPRLTAGALAGFGPLLIQVGSHEILLDDALALARAAAHDDVDTRLEVVSGAPHVFQAYAGQLPEGRAAIQRAGTFIAEVCGIVS